MLLGERVQLVPEEDVALYGMLDQHNLMGLLMTQKYRGEQSRTEGTPDIPRKVGHACNVVVLGSGGFRRVLLGLSSAPSRKDVESRIKTALEAFMRAYAT